MAAGTTRDPLRGRRGGAGTPLILGIFHTRLPRTFRLAGFLDLSTEQQLVDFLEAEVHKDGDLVLDLSELDFVDSAGLRAFVRLVVGLEGRGHLILRSPRETVRSSLEVSQLDRLDGLEVRLSD